MSENARKKCFVEKNVSKVLTRSATRRDCRCACVHCQTDPPDRGTVNLSKKRGQKLMRVITSTSRVYRLTNIHFSIYLLCVGRSNETLGMGWFGSR